MHHVLELDEILLNIFAHCNPPRFKNFGMYGRPPGAAADLAALARTCRVFKEPALDVLWSELSDLSPLALCLPEASYQIAPGSKWYSFNRPLEQAEWNILRSYTHRVRSILNFGTAFHADCVRTYLSPSTPDPLFPNLRHLSCVFNAETTPLLRQPFPSLTSLDYSFGREWNSSLSEDFLESFPRFSSDMRRLSIHVRQPDAIFNKLATDYICRWSNPQTVYCPRVMLGMDALIHLSRVPGFHRLSFALNTTLPDEIATCDALLFSKLEKLVLYSESLAPISKLLAHIQLPAITDFTADIEKCPSKQNITSFLTAPQMSSIGDSIMRLTLSQIRPSPTSSGSDPPVLASDDLRPIMAFSNLRRISLDLEWKVGLADNELLELASAWPYLEHLRINNGFGWRTSGGITPDGLVRLLQTSQSLSRISIAIDTRGYIEVPPSRSFAHFGSNILPSFYINVVDSRIETASVPAMAALLANIVPSIQFSFNAWGSSAFRYCLDGQAYAERWNDVYVRASEVVKQRFESRG